MNDTSQTYNEVAELKYVTAVFYETLRMFPVVSCPIRRVLIHGTTFANPH